MSTICKYPYSILMRCVVDVPVFNEQVFVTSTKNSSGSVF